MLNVTFALPFKHKRKLNLHNNRILAVAKCSTIQWLDVYVYLCVCANACMEFRIQCELNFNQIHFLMLYVVAKRNKICGIHFVVEREYK